MKITSAQFVKGVKGSNDALEDGIAQIAFIGRSNVGKSSLINALTNQSGLAKSSSFPGRTQEINLFLINEKIYFVDLPGYGFAKAPVAVREKLKKMIYWYLFQSEIEQKKVVLILDANVGPTTMDLEILSLLEEYDKDIVIVANKVDKIKKSEYQKQLQKINSQVGLHQLIPFSAEKKIGIQELLAILL